MRSRRPAKPRPTVKAPMAAAWSWNPPPPPPPPPVDEQLDAWAKEISRADLV